MARVFRRRFPWRENNRFRLLVNGGEIFPAMLEKIAEANSQILLEMYLVESGRLLDRFIEAFAAAVQRGVNVYLLFDDFGSRGLSEQDRQRMRQAGMFLAMYNPLHYGRLRRSLFRDHRKLLVVDGRVAFVSGVGLTDEFDPLSCPEDFWHDVAVQAQGPVLRDWQIIFQANWHYWARQSLPEVKPPEMQLLSDKQMVPADAFHQKGRVSGGRYFGAAGIQRSFVKHARHATERVWMMTAYFVPPRSLLRALRNAARHGVDVRLVLPGPKTDHPAVRYAGHRFYYSLLRAGVRIYEYQPRFVHAKVMLCDDWVSLGSCNADRWNLRWNLEANQEVLAEEFALRVRALFMEDMAQSKECHIQDWQRRPSYWRVSEWFWGNVAQWLDTLSVRLRRKRK
ncbi:MAG TPA: phosphatidylserine/phosphatidylglycerophosphate/cardiolipin synthase family protein [Gammaproteobacteria bacterium]|nr:phosphatidylserine/phosphatidylglycerophosphate/cardiolipin synthase family protein [Gammaproteobacteria bacterium]